MLSDWQKKLMLMPLAGLAVCPRRWRFAVIRQLARGLWPVLRVLKPYQLHSTSLQGHREVALKLFLYAFIRQNIPFTTTLELQPAGLLEDSTGVLLLTCHFNMNRLLLRWLSERGRRISVVTVHPDLADAVGLEYSIELIPPDAQCLRRIRQRVKEGNLVYLTVESANPSAKHCHPVELGGEMFYLSDTVFRFAEQARLPVLFAVTCVGSQGQVVVKLARPSTPRADIAFAEFRQFLTTEVAQFY